MKVILLVAAISMLLVNLLGTTESVGGPLTALLLSLLIILSVGVYASWSMARSALGRLIVLSGAFEGGLVTLSLFGMTMEAALEQFHFQGVLARSWLSYPVSAAEGLAVATGAWLPSSLYRRLSRRSA